MQRVSCNKYNVPIRTCNRHTDCDKAEREWIYKNPGKHIWVNFHCHDDVCEDCFGA